MFDSDDYPVQNQEMYVQCTLFKKTETGNLTRTIWGPAKVAKLDKIVKVEEEDGSWTTNWIVKAVHGNPLPYSIVNYRSRDHLRQRKASDI